MVSVHASVRVHQWERVRGGGRKDEVRAYATVTPISLVGAMRGGYGGRMAKTPEQIIREHMAALGRKGSAARMAKMTPAERSEMMRKASVKRWRAYRRKKREKSS